MKTEEEIKSEKTNVEHNIPTNNGPSSDNKTSDDSNKQPSTSAENKEDFPEPPALFGWELIGENVLTLYIKRLDECYIPIALMSKLMKRLFFSIFETEVFADLPYTDTQMTSNEASTLNDVNKNHCDSNLLGSYTFTSGDFMMPLETAKKYKQYLDACLSLYRNRAPNPLFGFILINGQNTLPFVWNEGVKLVPMFFFEGQSEFLDENAIEVSDRWQIAYLRFCCRAIQIKRDHYENKSIMMVDFEHVRQLFSEDMKFEIEAPKYLNDQLLVRHSRDQCQIGTNPGSNSDLIAQSSNERQPVNFPMETSSEIAATINEVGAVNVNSVRTSSASNVRPRCLSNPSITNLVTNCPNTRPNSAVTTTQATQSVLMNQSIPNAQTSIYQRNYNKTVTVLHNQQNSNYSTPQFTGQAPICSTLPNSSTNNMVGNLGNSRFPQNSQQMFREHLHFSKRMPPVSAPIQPMLEETMTTAYNTQRNTSSVNTANDSRNLNYSTNQAERTNNLMLPPQNITPHANYSMPHMGSSYNSSHIGGASSASLPRNSNYSVPPSNHPRFTNSQSPFYPVDTHNSHNRMRFPPQPINHAPNYHILQGNPVRPANIHRPYHATPTRNNTPFENVLQPLSKSTRNNSSVRMPLHNSNAFTHHYMPQVTPHSTRTTNSHNPYPTNTGAQRSDGHSFPQFMRNDQNYSVPARPIHTNNSSENVYVGAPTYSIPPTNICTSQTTSNCIRTTTSRSRKSTKCPPQNISASSIYSKPRPNSSEINNVPNYTNKDAQINDRLGNVSMGLPTQNSIIFPNHSTPQPSSNSSRITNDHILNDININNNLNDDLMRFFLEYMDPVSNDSMLDLCSNGQSPNHTNNVALLNNNSGNVSTGLPPQNITPISNHSTPSPPSYSTRITNDHIPSSTNKAAVSTELPRQNNSPLSNYSYPTSNNVALIIDNSGNVSTRLASQNPTRDLNFSRPPSALYSTKIIKDHIQSLANKAAVSTKLPRQNINSLPNYSYPTSNQTNNVALINNSGNVPTRLSPQNITPVSNYSRSPPPSYSTRVTNDHIPNPANKADVSTELPRQNISPVSNYSHPTSNHTNNVINNNSGNVPTRLLPQNITPVSNYSRPSPPSYSTRIPNDHISSPANKAAVLTELPRQNISSFSTYSHPTSNHTNNVALINNHSGSVSTTLPVSSHSISRPTSNSTKISNSHSPNHTFPQTKDNSKNVSTKLPSENISPSNACLPEPNSTENTYAHGVTQTKISSDDGSVRLPPQNSSLNPNQIASALSQNTVGSNNESGNNYVVVQESLTSYVVMEVLNSNTNESPPGENVSCDRNQSLTDNNNTTIRENTTQSTQDSCVQIKRKQESNCSKQNSKSNVNQAVGQHTIRSLPQMLPFRTYSRNNSNTKMKKLKTTSTVTNVPYRSPEVAVAAFTTQPNTPVTSFGHMAPSDQDQTMVRQNKLTHNVTESRTS